MRTILILVILLALAQAKMHSNGQVSMGVVNVDAKGAHSDFGEK